MATPIYEEFKTEQEALEWLKLTGLKMLRLAFQDTKIRNLKRKRHQASYERQRLSALVWVWVPKEGINELFTFDNVCIRLGLDPDDVRIKFKARFTDQEKLMFKRYRPYLFD